MNSAIIDKYDARALAVNSLLCVGLDSDLARLPERFHQLDYPRFEFNRWIIEQTHAYVAAYKANMAFYETQGAAGIHELKMTLDYLRAEHADIVTICDAKRGDIGNTNAAYAAAIFDELGCDAITLHPYVGREALAPFLARADKACIILCRTSNPGSDEFQSLAVAGRLLWEVVARQVAEEWNGLNNCMLVVGATYPETLLRARELVGAMTLLIPGVGAQGGDLTQIVPAGQNADGLGMIINVSRGVIFAENPAEAAEGFRDAINRYR